MKEALTPSNIMMLLGIALFSLLMFSFIIHNYKLAKKQKSRFKKLSEQKCKGPHKWVYINVGSERPNVCSSCCWSPKHNGFILRHHVDAEIAQNKFLEDLKEYADKKLKELGVSEELYDKVINIKKDFTIQHLEKQIKKMTSGE